MYFSGQQKLEDNCSCPKVDPKRSTFLVDVQGTVVEQRKESFDRGKPLLIGNVRDDSQNIGHGICQLEERVGLDPIYLMAILTFPTPNQERKPIFEIVLNLTPPPQRL